MSGRIGSANSGVEMELSDSELPLAPSFKNLEDENTRLRVDLEECKSRLFELSYEENQVSDGTIRKEYEDICEAMEKWIDDVFKEFDFTNTFNTILRKDPQRLARLGLYPGVQESEREEDGFPGMSWLSRKDTCNHIVISLVLWSFLQRQIFSGLFPLGVTPDQDLLFKEMLKVKGKERGDAAASVRTSKWRSETMTAMSKTLSFRANREKRLRALFGELIEELGLWIEEKTLDEYEEDLSNDIFLPAARLHRSITCSTREYALKEAEPRRNQFPNKSSPWTLKNIQSWRIVGYNTLDEKYRVFHRLSPGLSRCGVGNEADLELVKPVVIIYKTEQQRSIPSSPSPTRANERERQQIKNRSPKRIIRPERDRTSDSGSFTSSLSIFKPKKKSSEPKQEVENPHAQVSRPKSAPRHHSHKKSGRRSSRDHNGEQSSSQGHDSSLRQAATMPTSYEVYESSAAGPPRSSTFPESSNRRQIGRDYGIEISSNSMSGSSSVLQVSSGGVPAGTHVLTSKLDYHYESPTNLE